MKVDLATYLDKAQEAIGHVFVNEYHNSLGIPMPEVKMLLADDENYSTGLYYIQIDNTWQIHLNFGKLPISFKEFQDEVKVLTRHEIEHYMCCPFDILTHFKMLKCIRDVYNKDYAHLRININNLCGSIANQVADIIVDTKNFNAHPKETLLSEINWIKKGCSIEKCPRHSKLMFLTKEAIWKTSLDMQEKDYELLDIVENLSKLFLQGGIEDKNTFLCKTESYTRAFFDLYIKDLRDHQPQGQSGNGSQQGGQPQGQSGNGSQQGGQPQGQSGNGSQQGGQPQGQSGNGSQQGGQPQSQTSNGGQQNRPKNGEEHGNPSKANDPLKPKDGSKNGSTFVFADPDKIKEAIEALAQETTVEEFVEILSIAGIGGLTSKQKEKLWFSVQSSDIIPIEEESKSGNPINYTYPNTWRVGDSVESLDMMLSFLTSPKILPGITTKKWEKISTDSKGTEKKQRDLLLVVDTSGSMGAVANENQNMHQAVLAAFGILNYFEAKKGQVALVEFADKITAEVSWTKIYDDIRDRLLTNGNGGTQFPIRRIRHILDNSKNELVTVIITDGELGNLNESLNYFRNYLNDDNRLYVFLLGDSKKCRGYDELRDIGAHVYNANNAKDFCDMVVADLD